MSDLTDAERETLRQGFGDWANDDYAHGFAAVERIAQARYAEGQRDALAEAERRIEPWGPFEMDGFEGCTDRDPEHCACATDQQPTCVLCGREIEPGEMAWSRQWPCYETLPLGHRDQDWDVISWHDTCPDSSALRAESERPSYDKLREAGWQTPDDVAAAYERGRAEARKQLLALRDEWTPMVDQGSGAYLNPRVVCSRLDAILAALRAEADR